MDQVKKVLDYIKRNWISLTCGLIAILAIVALDWPISPMYATLLGQVDSRIQVSNSIDSLTNTQRTMPLLSPDDTNPQPLDVFPIDGVTQAAKKAMAEVTTQAQSMLDYATNLNTHQLLVPPDELPSPSQSARFAFANAYAAAITDYSRWTAVLDSTTPPSPAEVQAAKDALFADIKKNKLIYDQAGNVDQQSQQDAQAEYDERSPNVQPQMELERATEHQMYMMLPPAVNVLPVDATIKVGSYPSPEQICSAQIVMWMLDDITHAIRNANDAYSDPAPPGGPEVHDILHSAVKALEGVDPPQPMVSPTAVDPSSGVTSAVPKVPTVSPSGRVCNGRYDVLRFKVHLVVDIAKLPLIIKAIEANQFLTVLNVQITEIVDPAVAASNPQGGFRYGNKPVARVEIDCEDLLMRTWTDKILPDDMKNGLGKATLGVPTDDSGNPMYGPGGPGGPGFPGGPGGPYAPPPQ
jgi:hypothetical protein